MKLRLDFWNQFIKNKVASQDPAETAFLDYVPPLSKLLCETLYEQDGFGKKVVSLAVNEITSHGFTINGDTDGLISDYLKDFNFQDIMVRLATFARTFGGAIIEMGLDDGQDFDQPLNLNTFRSIEFMRVHDRYSVTYYESDLNQNVSSKYYNTPEWYTITPIRGTGSYRVHRSRVIKLNSNVINTNNFIENNQGWSASVYQAVLTELTRMGDIGANVNKIISDFVTKVINISNLDELIVDEQGRQDMNDRAAIMDITADNFNTIYLASEEQLQKLTTSVTGLADLMDRNSQRLGAVADPPIPQTVLMGTSPAGMNSTGKSDLDIWRSSCLPLQTNWLQYSVEQVVELVMLSKDGPTNGRIIEGWAVDWNPLSTMTSAERANVSKTIAETDKMNIESQIYGPEEARKRYEGTEFSEEIHIEGTIEVDDNN